MGKRQVALAVLTILALAFLSEPVFASEDREEVSALLAETYLASGQNDKAIEAYEKIIAKNPEDMKARISLARLLSWERRYGESIEQYQKIIEKDPSNVEALSLLAEVYVWRGDMENAEACYKKLVEMGEKNKDVLLSLAEVLIWNKKYSEALTFIEEASREKRSFRGEFLKAKALLYSGEYEKAEDTLKKTIASYPGESDIVEAKVLLADTYSYGKNFKEGAELYEVVLEEGGPLEVKEKLADVLSWDKQYGRALAVYDEVLEEKYDEKIHRQKARVLGWARRYSEAEKEYQFLLEKSENPGAALEAEAKKAYWTGRVKKAIKVYSELIEMEPSNTEAMFDLSQVFSYQSMWDSAINEYIRILEVSPTSFRAKEGKEKAVLISGRPLLTSGYRYFEADSPGRDMDMRVHEFSNNLRVPLESKLFLDLGYSLRGRMFEDFKDTVENEGKIKMTWIEGPEWKAAGYYGLVGYSGALDEQTHLFGGLFSYRILDIGEYTFTYDREKLENNSEVIRRHFTRNKFRNSAYFDITKRLKAGAEYMCASYSDGNFLNEPLAEVMYDIFLEPTKLSVGYKYMYKEFSDKVTEYFSPKGFSSNTFTVNWRHFLNREEIFFGADDLYYDLKYEMVLDSQYIVGHKFFWEANWDITKRLNFNVRGSVMGSSCAVYEESEFSIGVKYYF
jgi:tetratricopeptide (TPR) repeat protein